MNEWYRQHENHLPPGLEKQLQERGTLLPGLQKKIQPVPMDLERRLPPPPPGGCDCRHVFIGDHVALLGIRTNYVYNVFQFELQ